MYPRAAELAREAGASKIVDLGCGNGNKLALLMSFFETVGLDIGPNLKVCRERYPDAAWFEHDLNTPGPLPICADESVVICADVIEHVQRPELLLAKIRSALDDGAHAAVITTPERDLHWGVNHTGPSPNLAHVREWTWHEFTALLAGNGFRRGTLELTRSRELPPHRNTILAIVRP